MKSELRNELKSNLLADRLEEIVLAIKPHLLKIGFGLVALVAAAILYGIVRTQGEKTSASAWSELYFSANRVEKLDEVYQDFPSTSAGLWARQKTADSLQARALEQVYIDRDLADKLLEEAAQAYKAVLAKASEPMLVCRATYGLAQVLDSQGNAEDAAREFKKILTLPGAHSEMVADAQRRLEFIASDKGRQFYAWFKTNRPTAPKPVDVPSDLGKLPSEPDMKFGASPAIASPDAPVVPPQATDATPKSDFEVPPAVDSPKPATTKQDTTGEATPSAPAAKPPALEPPVDEPTAGTTPSGDVKSADEPVSKPKEKAKKAKKEKAEADLKIPEPEAAKKADGS